MGANISRRQLIVGAGAGAIGTAAAMAAAPVTAFASDDARDGVEGSWYVIGHFTTPAGIPDIDVTYSFARGGVFIRIDGRNNAPSVGTWTKSEDGSIVFSGIAFNFNGLLTGTPPSPATRNGAIVGNFKARVGEDGKLVGTFSAHGILGLNGFFRAGTFTGTRIEAVGP